MNSDVPYGAQDFPAHLFFNFKNNKEPTQLEKHMASIAQKIAKSWQARREEEQRAERAKNALDKDIPFDLRINGKVNLTPLLPESLQESFPAGGYLVREFARYSMNLGQGKSIHAFVVYVDREDRLGEISYLQILVDPRGNKQVRWFRDIDNDNEPHRPIGDADWGFWLDDATGSIGLRQFQSKDNVLYDRIWDPEGAERVKPPILEFTHYPDKYDATKAYKTQHEAMLYARTAKDQNALECEEYVLVSSVTVPERPGEDRDDYIEIVRGIDLKPGVDMIYVY